MCVYQNSNVICFVSSINVLLSAIDCFPNCLLMGGQTDIKQSKLDKGYGKINFIYGPCETISEQFDFHFLLETWWLFPPLSVVAEYCIDFSNL